MQLIAFPIIDGPSTYFNSKSLSIHIVANDFNCECSIFLLSKIIEFA